MLTFTVHGVAQHKGSMRAYVPRGMKFPIVTDSNRNARSWAQLVAEGANRVLNERDNVLLEQGPVRVEIIFYLPRPKKYAKKPDAAHVTAPDVDKLSRGVLDALTSVAYVDDSQVVELLAYKRYAAIGEIPRARITVEHFAAVPLFDTLANPEAVPCKASC